MTVVCVAAAVTSAGVAALGEAGAAAASGLAASAADKDNHREDEEAQSTGSQQEESNAPSPPSTEQAPTSLSKAVENQLEALQEANAHQPIFNRAEPPGSIVDSVRETAAYITHDALNGAASVGALVPSLQEEGQGVYGSIANRSADSDPRQGGPRENYQQLIENAHKVIDRLFGTNQMAAFSPEAVASNDKFDVGIIPLPSAPGEGRILPTQTNDVRGWKIGEPINNRTVTDRTPKWDTVRQRYWKNEALLHPEEYNAHNLDRMKKGLAPQRINPTTGEIESRELHHIPPQREGGLFDFIKVWPDEHAELDRYRHIGK